MSSEFLLELVDGCITRDDHVVLKNFNFQIGSRECVALRGPNGSGKSTLLLALSSERFLSEGQLKWNDRLVSSIPIGEMASIRAVMLQTDDASDQLLTKDVIEISTKGKSTFTSEQEFVDLLVPNEIKLTRIGNLSVGQRARVFLAMAVLQDAQLLFLDEPTAALDDSTARELAHYIARQLAKGKSVLVATHDDRILEVATRTVLLGD